VLQGGSWDVLQGGSCDVLQGGSCDMLQGTNMHYPGEDEENNKKLHGIAG
jgi:hypothetical protein